MEVKGTVERKPFGANPGDRGWQVIWKLIGMMDEDGFIFLDQRTSHERDFASERNALDFAKLAAKSSATGCVHVRPFEVVSAGAAGGIVRQYGKDTAYRYDPEKGMVKE